MGRILFPFILKELTWPPGWPRLPQNLESCSLHLFLLTLAQAKLILLLIPTMYFLYFICIFLCLKQDGFIKEHDLEDLSPVKSHKAGHSPLLWWEPRLPFLLRPSLPFYSPFSFSTHTTTRELHSLVTRGSEVLATSSGKEFSKICMAGWDVVWSYIS